jgi:single-strand DNA-binding protein
MSDQLFITATINKIGDPQQVTEKLTKRDLVLNVGDKYPQTPSVEFINDKGDLLDGFNVGDTVKVYFNLRGREYNGRYYTSLDGWKVEGIGNGPSTAQTPSANRNPALRAQPAPIADDSNDLPF